MNPLDEMATAYCGAFSTELNKCVCPLLNMHVRVVFVAGNFKVDASEISYITVAWAEDFYSGALDDTLNAWGAGQKVQ